MNALFPRVDGQLGFALAVSAALHAVVLFAVLAVTQETPAPKVVSAINLRLSTSVTPAPQATIALPEEVVQISDPVIETVPETPVVEVEAVDEEPWRTSAPVIATPTETRPLKIDPASLEAFVGSTTKLLPPSLDTEIDIAELYRRQWHQRVQRIGQLNYPEAATKMKLTGQLTLIVAINTDGSLASVGIVQSSGYDELDFAALEIVRQSSPFEPLPPNLPRSNGKFRFDSTWEFRR
ncbi:MAG: TonB family protein [Gammaproteobacteria bacterium]|nr:TonB family protein [Gammaproteobacteria bacterium]